jgi:GTP cyclohydrolase I
MLKTGASSNGHSYVPNGSSFSDIVLDEIGSQHVASSIDTPLREGAFELTDDEKVAKIQRHFSEIMNILGLDLTDDSLSGTPRRVAKMFVKEIFSGLHPDKKPAISLFDNKFQYKQMLVEKGIKVQSFCEHHFLPIQGVAHVAYIANQSVIGLSKLNRIVEYYARRPQVQERLTVQIAEELRQVLGTDDVAVYIDAKHMCVEMRGIEHQGCSTVTTEYSGKFLNEHTRSEFLQAIK